MAGPAPFKLPATAAELTARYGGRCVNEAAAVTVGDVAALAEAGPASLSFFASHKYRAQLERTAAAVVVLHERDRALRARPAVLVDAEEARDYIARVLADLGGAREFAGGVHPAASVDPAAQLGDQVHVGAGAVVGAQAAVGARSKILARAVVTERCVIGADCLLHEGSVTGSEGFGFTKDGSGERRRIAHHGRVVLGDRVELGANSCIDRGTLGDTVIGAGTKIDNMVQIGHNVRIGADCIVCGCTGIAGSVRIGARCTLGGRVSIADHVAIADDVTLYGGTTVLADIKTPGAVYGSPIMHLPVDRLKRLWRGMLRMSGQERRRDG